MSATGDPHRLLHVFSTFAAAGPQVRTVKLIEALGGEFTHEIMALDGCTDGRDLLPSNTSVRFVDPPPKAGTLRTTLRLRDALEASKPDLLLTYNWGAVDAVLAARALGFGRVLHHEDGFRPDEAHAQKRRRAWYRRWLLSGVHRVIVISRTLERIALRNWRLGEDRLAFVPNGIDASSFPAADGHPELRKSLGIPPGAFVVGAVGHLRPEKNVARLLSACEPLQERCDLHVLVLGEGPERGALEERARVGALAGRVHLVGYRSDPRDYYRAMDLFAISSDTEQMPIALLEAMACSLPAAATDVGDVRAVLPPEQGELIAPPDIASLSAVIERAASDRTFCRSLGERNRTHVREAFAEETMAARYRELYCAALRARSPW